jgi:amino-acid N-acetyltransferase
LLVAELERHATAEGVKVIYLLTTTAEPFFAHRGYGRVPRDAVPSAIRATAEFASLCPTSSAVMRKPSDVTGREGGP